LLEDLREANRRPGAELEALNASARLSDEYHNRLAETCTLMTWLEGLAPDIKNRSRTARRSDPRRLSPLLRPGEQGDERDLP
jgi:hypothetical protein